MRVGPCRHMHARRAVRTVKREGWLHAWVLQPATREYPAIRKSPPPPAQTLCHLPLENRAPIRRGVEPLILLASRKRCAKEGFTSHNDKR